MPTIKLLKTKRKPRNKNLTIDFAKYYNSIAWKHLRNNYIEHHPLCEECLLQGKTTLAEQVHHIKEFSRGTTEEERWNLLLDPNNLQSLCRECHSKKHPNKFHKIKK